MKRPKIDLSSLNVPLKTLLGDIEKKQLPKLKEGQYWWTRDRQLLLIVGVGHVPSEVSYPDLSFPIYAVAYPFNTKEGELYDLNENGGYLQFSDSDYDLVELAKPHEVLEYVLKREGEKGEN